jgi:UV DNA damage endonuclease
MKIGYPCINWTIGCKGDRTFRLKSYSEERLIETVENNLDCLATMLNFNIKNNLLFFRITSDLIPFASHSICKFKWQKYFKNEFEEIGRTIRENNIRISMHPDQFIVLNSKDPTVVIRSIAELHYHAEVLDLMNLDKTAKIQLHAGGAYGDKKESLIRFADNYEKLDEKIKNRLVIENDDKIYSFKDCLFLHGKIKVPLLFDVFHHKILNHKESVKFCLEKQSRTWDKKDGIPMVDYSSQKPGFKTGSHTESIDLKDFKRFLDESKPYDFDIMLEIKDKEASALKALKYIEKDKRFIKKS